MTLIEHKIQNLTDFSPSRLGLFETEERALKNYFLKDERFKDLNDLHDYGSIAYLGHCDLVYILPTNLWGYNHLCG